MKAGFLLARPSKRAAHDKRIQESQQHVSTPPPSTTTTNRRVSSHKPVGIAKGFLLSTTSNTVTRRTPKQSSSDTHHGARVSRNQASQDLLVLEESSWGSSTSNTSKTILPLNILDQEADSIVGRGLSPSVHKEPVKPLITVMHEEFEADTRNHRRLMSIVDADNEEGGGEISSNKDKQKNEASLISSNHIQCSPGFSATQLRDVHTSTTHTHTQLHQKAEERVAPHHELGLTDVSTVTVDRSVTFLEFQQQLLRRDWEENDTTISLWSSKHVSWAWQWLGGRPRASVVRLSDALLKYHPQSVGEFLAPETVQERALSLQIIQLMQMFLVKEDDIPRQSLETWENQTLVQLTRLADQSRRSVLVQEAWTASILLIDRLCLQGNGLSGPSNINILQDATERLLRAQLQWKQNKIQDTTRSAAWIFLIQVWIEAIESHKSDSLMTPWQVLVQGCMVHKGRRWGGLRQVFCSDMCDSSVSSDAALVWTDLRHGHYDSPSKTIHRKMLLCGLLSQMASRKKFLTSVQDEMIENVFAILPKLTCKTECTIAVLMLYVSS
jgi:hypothetical protein